MAIEIGGIHQLRFSYTPCRDARAGAGLETRDSPAWKPMVNSSARDCRDAATYAGTSVDCMGPGRPRGGLSLFSTQGLKRRDDVQKLGRNCHLTKLTRLGSKRFQMVLDITLGNLHGSKTARVFAGERFGECAK